MRIAVAVLVVVLAPGMVAAQSLGEIARKEKERRGQQPLQPSAKTYTQEDLKALPPVQNAVGAAGQKDAEASAPAGPKAMTRAGDQDPDPDATAATDDERQAREEASWRNRLAAAEQRLQKAKALHETLSGYRLVPGYQYVDPKTGKVLYSSPEEIQRDLAKVKEEIQAAEQEIERIHEDARHQGIPPGWLR